MVNKKVDKPTPMKKPLNLENYKKAVSVGREMSKIPNITKVKVAKEMFGIIHNEDREVIARAFVEGANLTTKGAMTYVYNIRRKWKNPSKS